MLPSTVVVLATVKAKTLCFFAFKLALSMTGVARNWIQSSCRIMTRACQLYHTIFPIKEREREEQRDTEMLYYFVFYFHGNLS